MPTTESGKNWQRRNADKARAYATKYSEKKVKVCITLDPWVAEEINKVKHPDQALGNWIRLHLEEWGKENMKAG